MSEHKMVNGQLLQMNKNFDQLKQKQKEKIIEWMYSDLSFPDVLTEEKQYKELSNLLKKTKIEGLVDVRGSAVHAE